MKIASLIFIVLIFLIAFKYTKIFDVSMLIMIGVFCLWVATVYIQVQLKNKERRTPKPVYITDK